MSLERELIQLFGDRTRALEALDRLCGGVSGTHLRTLQLSGPAYGAFVGGLSDPNPRVRWWCIQVLDHVPESRAVEAIAIVLDDPVPRVRRNAVHALGCVACKPDWLGGLPREILERLGGLAVNDPNAKVRAQAQWARSCWSG